MTTIKKLAELAGVSTTTVSNVIHGKTKRVSPQTIRRIEKLIEEEGYVQKMGLRVLNQEKSQLIAVVVNYHRDFKDSILGDPFYGKVVGFIEEYAREKGYYLIFYATQDINQIFKMAMGWDVDGVIAISFSRNNCEKLYRLIQKPVVTIDAYGKLEEEQESHVINIGLDDVGGGYLMTKYLLKCGYENIKVCAAKDRSVDHQRLMGAQQAEKEYAGERQKVQFIAVGTSYTKRKQSYERLLQRMQPKTALFFLSDIYAMEAISFLSNHGIRIPDDVGIAGFDDISIAAFSTPRLTTVRQEVKEKARSAVEVLMHLIEGDADAKEVQQDIQLPVSLVIRNSAKQNVKE